jgi:hypothetical protein
MWVLVENDDMSVDIVAETAVITDSEVIEGLEVGVMYPDPKNRRKQREFRAKVHGKSGKLISSFSASLGHHLLSFICACIVLKVPCLPNPSLTFAFIHLLHLT